VAVLGCRESARSPQRGRRVGTGIVEELVEELFAGAYANAGIRALGETPLTLAITSEEGLQAFALRWHRSLFLPLFIHLR